MDRNRIVPHRLDSPAQDCYDEVSIRKSNVARLRHWVAMQSSEVQARFCDHGSYVDHDRGLAYLCPMCPEQ